MGTYLYKTIHKAQLAMSLEALLAGQVNEQFDANILPQLLTTMYKREVESIMHESDSILSSDSESNISNILDHNIDGK